MGDTCVCGHVRSDHDDERKHCLAQDDEGRFICECQRFDEVTAALTTLRAAVRRYRDAKAALMGRTRYDHAKPLVDEAHESWAARKEHEIRNGIDARVGGGNSRRQREIDSNRSGAALC